MMLLYTLCGILWWGSLIGVGLWRARALRRRGFMNGDLHRDGVMKLYAVVSSLAFLALIIMTQHPSEGECERGREGPLPPTEISQAR